MLEMDDRVDESKTIVNISTTDCSSNSEDENVLQREIEVNSGDKKVLDLQNDELRSTDVAIPDDGLVLETVIEINPETVASGGRNESICRICHMNSESAAETCADTNSTTFSTDLIQLGCACKDELGAAHAHCAETWFKLKGNRKCEICGETAANVGEVAGEERWTEEWNGRRINGDDGSMSERRGECWRRQWCNMVMTVMVMVFVLPWFFRVNTS